MPRGGRRRGTTGKQYPNRSDLRGPGTPDIPKSFQGQPYGTAVQQEQAQSVAPASPPVGPPGGGGGVSPPTVPPGGFGAFTRGSERPDEPITAGLKSGPGPGPEALGMHAGDPEDADLRDMALYLPTLEYLAGMPGSSRATRNFVRRLKGAITPEVQNGNAGSFA